MVRSFLIAAVLCMALCSSVSAAPVLRSIRLTEADLLPELRQAVDTVVEPTELPIADPEMGDNENMGPSTTIGEEEADPSEMTRGGQGGGQGEEQTGDGEMNMENMDGDMNTDEMTGDEMDGPSGNGSSCKNRVCRRVCIRSGKGRRQICGKKCTCKDKKKAHGNMNSKKQAAAGSSNMKESTYRQIVK